MLLFFNSNFPSGRSYYLDSSSKLTVAEQPMHLEVGHSSSKPVPVVLDLQSL